MLASAPHKGALRLLLRLEGLLALAGFIAVLQALTAAGLILTAHIGLDRALGYGLKYSTAFGHSHIGRIGRR